MHRLRSKLVTMLLVARCTARDCTLSGVVEGGSAWSFNLAGCSFVDLSASNLPEDGLLALAEVLNTNTELTSLRLRHNSMSDNGVRALADALKINDKQFTTLTARVDAGQIGGFVRVQISKESNT
jgi:hypothetical protein